MITVNLIIILIWIYFLFFLSYFISALLVLILDFGCAYIMLYSLGILRVSFPFILHISWSKFPRICNNKRYPFTLFRNMFWHCGQHFYLNPFVDIFFRKIIGNQSFYSHTYWSIENFHPNPINHNDLRTCIFLQSIFLCFWIGWL